MAAPVKKGEELELRVDSLAYGGNGVARLDGFVVFVRRGLPGDLVRARVTKVKRSHAEALAIEVLEAGRRAGRGAVRPLPGLRRLSLPGSRLRGAGRGEGVAGAGRARPARRDRRAAARADRAGRVGLPLPQQARVLVHAHPGGAGARLPPGRPLGRGARDREVLAHDRPRQRDPERRARLGARGGARGLRPGGRQRLPAPPRRPRGPQHRPGARPARDRARARGSRPATSSTCCAASPRCARSTGRSTTRPPR